MTKSNVNAGLGRGRWTGNAAFLILLGIVAMFSIVSAQPYSQNCTLYVFKPIWTVGVES